MKKISRRSFLQATGVVAITTAVTACSSASTSSESTSTTTSSASTSVEASDAVDPTTEEMSIRFSWWGGDSRHEATQAAVDAFMVKYPNITVNAEFGSWTGWEESFANQVLSSTLPDVVQGNFSWVDIYNQNRDAFYDINELSDYIDLSQWPDNMLKQVEVDGMQLMIPVSSTGRTFYWNETTFEEAGLSIPTTLEALMAAGPIFESKLGDGYYPLSMSEYDRMIFIVHYLESIYGKDWIADGELQYTEEQILEGFAIIAKMEEEHVIPTIKTLDGSGTDSLSENPNWIEGRYAGCFEWDTSISTAVVTVTHGTIVVGGPLTDIGDYQGGFVKISMGFAISADTEYPVAGAMLIDFLLNDEEGVMLMSTERGIPLSTVASKILSENDELDTFALEATEAVLGWNAFSIDTTFENAAFKSDPDGVYYKAFANVSYEEWTSEEGASYLYSEIVDFLAEQ